MAADPSGLDLLLMASNSANAGGAGLPLSSPPFGVKEEDYSGFDLAIRREKLDTCFEWATESKAHAEDLLFGARPGVIWWWRISRAVHSYPLEHATLSAGTCVHAFHIERDVCEKLRMILDDPERYTDKKVLVLADKEFPGYAGYPYVHADGGVLPFVQERRTVRVQKYADVNFLLRNVQEIWDLVQAVRRALGLPLPERGALQPRGKAIKAMHFLLQDATQQASFSWHSDAEDIVTRNEPRQVAEEMTTVIVSLSDVHSAMRIWGCTPVVYTRGISASYISDI